MKVSFDEMYEVFKTVLVKTGFKEDRAVLCARIFAENSRDGVYSHGLNRFPAFVRSIEEGVVDIHAEPECASSKGNLQQWDGHFAPGMYAATLAMKACISLAKENGIGCIAMRNANHWMRGGTYGWQAADEGCIAICSSNTIANMPPWGGVDPRLGNNPLVIAVPRSSGHMVLDMAMTQFSYGKLQEYDFKGEALPVAGGYDFDGHLSTDAGQIRRSQRTLPIGFWKGSGLSFMLDVILASLSAGRSVSAITAGGNEKGLSQLFICIDARTINDNVAEEIISYTKTSGLTNAVEQIYYPGERTKMTRERNLKEGIPVNEQIWKKVLAFQNQ